MNNRLCFLILPLMMTAWRKKDALFCTSHWDCPRHQHCHAVFSGVCPNPPPQTGVGCRFPIPWNQNHRPYRNFLS